MKLLIYNKGIKRKGLVEYEKRYLNADLIKTFHISTDGKFLFIQLIDGEGMTFSLGGSCAYSDSLTRALAGYLVSENPCLMAIGTLVMSSM